ncbi:MAG: hypothetical protein ACI87E_005125 [Mariniblastus sp.]|jgi:hypothetical protein
MVHRRYKRNDGERCNRCTASGYRKMQLLISLRWSPRDQIEYLHHQIDHTLNSLFKMRLEEILIDEIRE